MNLPLDFPKTRRIQACYFSSLSVSQNIPHPFQPLFCPQMGHFGDLTKLDRN